MCGIAGYRGWRDSATVPEEATLRAVNDALRTRGPDGEGLWFDEARRTGFAHRRLAIIDLSPAGLQPMQHGALRIVYNGEIYNYRALRAELEAKGRKFRSNSDTEVILQLYEAEGPAMLARLRGMFALAIWDEQAQTLLLARDPYGIKPLYYANKGGCLRFASQVKALARDPGVSRQLSPAGLAGFRMLGSVPEPFTILADVRACPAGHYLTVGKNGASEPVRFAGIAGTIARHTADTPGDAAEALRDSVRHHLEADVPVGVFLSGGVDSGAIVGLMRDCGQAEIAACTLRFEEFAGKAADETARAEAVAQHYAVDHHIRTVTPAEFAEDLPRIFAAMDQPSVDGFNSWFVSKAVHELGLKVALSGLGGDELLGGYPSFRTVPAMHRYAGAAAKLPGLGAASRMALRTLAPQLLARNPKLGGVLSYAGSWAGSWLLRRAVLLPYEVEGAMDSGLAQQGLRELGLIDAIGTAIDPDPGSDFGRVCALESSLYMRNQLLRDADWAGMAHSLEIRTPLVDIVLLARMAPHFTRLAQGDGKTLLANAPTSPLPAAITETAKTGFETPVASWLGSGAAATGDRTASRRSTAAIFDRYQASLAA